MEGREAAFGLRQTTPRFSSQNLTVRTTKQRAVPGSDPELRSSIGSTQVCILQILKGSTAVTSFTLRDDE
jgi:hypothetical protein